MDYVKLKDLVGGTFTVQKFWGYTFKKWSSEEKKMLTADRWQEGFKKYYQLDTDRGKLDLSASQLGQVLEAHVRDGKVDLEGSTTQVKSNGKEGMEIRYYFNAILEPDTATQIQEEMDEEPPVDALPKPSPEDEPVSLDDIPF